MKCITTVKVMMIILKTKMYNGSSSDREGSITEKDNLVTDDVNGENINSKF